MNRQFITFLNSFNNHFKSEDTRKSIKEEVEKLRHTVLKIERCFGIIQKQLEQIDEKGVVLDKEGKVRLFAPKWKRLHKKFTILIDYSRTSANQVKGSIGTLLQVIIPILDNKYARETQQLALDGYIKSVEQFEREGLAHKNGFATLRDQVESFRIRLHENVFGKTEQVRASKVRIDAQISQLEGELQQTDGLFAYLLRHFKSVPRTGLGPSFAAIKALKALSPLVVVGAFVVGIGALGVSVKAAHSQGKVDKEKQSDLTKLKHVEMTVAARLSDMEAVAARMAKLDRAFNGIVPRLGAIQNIWQMLIMDAQTLRERLDFMAHAEEDVTFGLCAKTVEALYESLYYALDQYCLAG
ncbi:hypothetical protein BDN72DRAFT_463096 [Pluteus cervinus]|uniref:Uncharacterized protein n=1 Tax=Pluteus cervinus TaxID=181527 RepID=A0ACD3B0M4_9AGAR|nr:hypothetical protein BDN72DRAFT_463096 [Pluteus cervinus]